METTLTSVTQKKDRDPVVQAALRSAMLEMVALAGGKQIDVETKYGIPQSKISYILKGIREPRLDTLLIMRRVLNRSLDDILGLPPIGLAGRVAALERAAFGRPEDKAKLEKSAAETAPSVPATSHKKLRAASKKATDR